MDSHLLCKQMHSRPCQPGTGLALLSPLELSENCQYYQGWLLAPRPPSTPAPGLSRQHDVFLSLVFPFAMYACTLFRMRSRALIYPRENALCLIIAVATTACPARQPDSPFRLERLPSRNQWPYLPAG